ncbi:class II glutamine amidotransferase [Bifidobacterium vansinderenii]|uniref:Glutamine amidotransferase n=1 Tax=Bifidobacterium vansinderenii TaxID=1984871 RepID=A0A229VWS6_9BIFI|nr:class II glutamine amidotransferase [Bifidobacterium vansinderenii]OXN00052.1 glutamine amidotransferase [Bifidobacterium vansinderenii]
MCVIVTAQPGHMPDPVSLALMSQTNPDGAGIAWHDGHRLHVHRHPDNHQLLAYIHANWQAIENGAALIHFRLATHGAVCLENTHPFPYTLPNGETGWMAHNGIAHAHTHGPYDSDSRNAIDAWQNGEADLTDGVNGKFALITGQGEIRWLTGEQALTDGVSVSNTWWMDPAEWTLPYELGYQTAIDDLEANGYDYDEYAQTGIPDWRP